MSQVKNNNQIPNITPDALLQYDSAPAESNNTDQLRQMYSRSPIDAVVPQVDNEDWRNMYPYKNNFIETDFHPNDPIMTRYDSDNIARIARHKGNFDNEINWINFNNPRRFTTRKGNERRNNKYRAALEERLNSMTSGGTSYKQGVMNYADPSGFKYGSNDQYGRAMDQYLAWIIDNTPKPEHRAPDTLSEFASRYGFQREGMTEDEMVNEWRRAYLGKTGKTATDQDIYNEYLKPISDAYQQFMGNLTTAQYLDLFRPSFRRSLNSPEAYKARFESNPLHGDLLRDDAELRVRGWHHPYDFQAPPAANTVYAPKFVSGQPSHVGQSGANVTIQSGAGSGQATPQNDPSPSNTPVAPVYSLSRHLNPVEEDIYLGKAGDIDNKYLQTTLGFVDQQDGESEEDFASRLIQHKNDVYNILNSLGYNTDINGPNSIYQLGNNVLFDQQKLKDLAGPLIWAYYTSLMDNDNADEFWNENRFKNNNSYINMIKAYENLPHDSYVFMMPWANPNNPNSTIHRLSTIYKNNNGEYYLRLLGNDKSGQYTNVYPYLPWLRGQHQDNHAWQYGSDHFNNIYDTTFGNVNVIKK